MANLAALLKTEIARVARKEVRAEIESLKKANTEHRAAIAKLRREVEDLRRQLKSTVRAAKAAQTIEAQEHADVPRRFSAARLAAHRAKVGLSAALYGQLVGMSGATVYLWEQGKLRPNPEQIQRLAALRSLSRTALLARLKA